MTDTYELYRKYAECLIPAAPKESPFSLAYLNHTKLNRTDPTTGAEHTSVSTDYPPTTTEPHARKHEQEALALALQKNGMSGLARCVAYMRPGEIEARLWQMLHTLPRGASARDRDEIELCLFLARRIRKPINDWDDFFARFFVAVTR